MIHYLSLFYGYIKDIRLYNSDWFCISFHRCNSYSAHIVYQINLIRFDTESRRVIKFTYNATFCGNNVMENWHFPCFSYVMRLSLPIGLWKLASDLEQKKKKITSSQTHNFWFTPSKLTAAERTDLIILEHQGATE